MPEHKPIATIETDAGAATIFFNGAGEALTAEYSDDRSEEIGYTAKSLDDAIDAVFLMYHTGAWSLNWIE